MANDYIERLYERPDPKGNKQEVTYSKDLTSESGYVQHQPYEDKLAILVCQIKIWRAEGTDWFKIPKADSGECLTIRECESIEIADSAKDLVNKAVLRFPRGTIISKSSMPDKKVKTGDAVDSTETEVSVDEATNNGDMIVPGSAQYSDDGTPTTSMAVNYDDKGMIDYQRSKEEVALLSPHDVAIGNRIEIRLGYAYSEKEFNEMNSKDNGADDKLDVAFTGFITAISVDTPLEIECTNMAHVLMSVSAPNTEAKSTITVKDFLDEGGKYELLKDTGIKLAKCSEGSEIFVTGGTLTDNLSVADVLTEWSKSGVQCIMETLRDGSVQLRVGLVYYAGQNGTDLPNNDKKYITYNEGIQTVKLIQFDWDVAQDKLSLKQNDKKYLAVEAHGKKTDPNDKAKMQFFKVTVRKNPDNDDEGWIIGDEDFQVVNKRPAKPKKKGKRSGGTTNPAKTKGHLNDKVKLDKYMIVPYISQTQNVTQDQLVEEAKQYWAKYNPNGISGSILIFGDIHVKPTEIIGLIDLRQPEKNGYYYVESVNTTFGTSGYRRELTIPFKIATFAKPVQIIK